MRILLIVALTPVFLLVGKETYAQQAAALAVCAQLASPELIDRTSQETSLALARSEFNLFCADRRNLQTRANAKGSSYTGGGIFAGSALGIGTNSTSASSLSEENIDKVCEIGIEEFSYQYAQSFSSNNGSALARIVADCVDNVIGGDQSDTIFGTVSLDPTGRSIFADVSRRAGNAAPTYVFGGVNRSDRFTDCRVGNKSADEVELKRELSISCAINLTPQEEEQGGASVAMGSLVFESSTGDSPNVRFSAIRSDIIADYKANTIVPLQRRLDLVENDIRTLKEEVRKRPTAETVTTTIDDKVRRDPIFHTIYLNAGLQAGVTQETDQGLPVLRKRIMPSGDGICTLSQVGFEGSMVMKSHSTVDVREGVWMLQVYVGQAGPRAGFVGATCWKWK